MSVATNRTLCYTATMLTNNIALQFTAPDLAAIATKLDQLESGYDDANLGDTSTNMDDTGMFSFIF